MARSRAANRERSAKWRAANPAKMKANWIKWHAANPGKRKKSTARWNAANRKKMNANNAKWRAAHPAECAALRALRRVRKLAAAVPLTPHEQADVIALYAKARALTELTGVPYHVDHKKPLAKGGLHHPDNLQVLRGVDNQRKGAKWNE